jgi:hypothetical protein
MIAPAASGQRGGMNVPEHAGRPVVMELFSSQGCGNCPAANENIEKLLAERSDVIALTYPVGIWDYLGWDDTFAKPEFTDRQKRYNRALNYRGPYTPQVVYSGRVHGPGTNIKDIEEAFGRRDITPYPVSVSLADGGATISGALPQGVEKARHRRRSLPPRRHQGHARRRREQGQADVLLEPGDEVRVTGRVDRRVQALCSLLPFQLRRHGAEEWHGRAWSSARPRRSSSELLRDRAKRRRIGAPIQLVQSESPGRCARIDIRSHLLGAGVASSAVAALTVTQPRSFARQLTAQRERRHCSCA